MGGEGGAATKRATLGVALPGHIAGGVEVASIIWLLTTLGVGAVGVVLDLFSGDMGHKR
jgi:hypothetical protein